MKTITLDRLAGACQEQLALVRKEWPDGIPLTEASALRAVEVGLDLDWLAWRLLTPEALVKYEMAKVAPWADYKRVTTAAWADFERAKVAALAEYDRVENSASAAFERAKAMTLLALLLV